MKDKINYEKNINKFFNNVIKSLINLKVLIIYDSSTKNLIKYFLMVLKKRKIYTVCEKISLKKNHGFEPSKRVEKIMYQSHLVLCLTKFSMAHSKARKNFSKKGGRFLSMPGYNKKILNNKALRVDFIKYHSDVEKISKKFSSGRKCKIISDNGTNLECEISGRIANTCPGHVLKEGSLGSPPDIESNISPIENKSNGTLIVDGSIADEKIGLLKHQVLIELKNGSITNIKSKSKKIVKLLNQTFKKFGPKSKILAEIGIGMNKKSELTGHMLTDEGAYGCIHFGFGSNFSVGGKNKVGFHLDFITKNHSLYIDEKKIIENGKILIK